MSSTLKIAVLWLSTQTNPSQQLHHISNDSSSEPLLEGHRLPSLKDASESQWTEQNSGVGSKLRFTLAASKSNGDSPDQGPSDSTDLRKGLSGRIHKTDNKSNYDHTSGVGLCYLTIVLCLSTLLAALDRTIVTVIMFVPLLDNIHL